MNETLVVKDILDNVNNLISVAEQHKARFKHNPKWYIWDICGELSIFDWWNDLLSVSQLKQMRKFLETALKLGFDGYACFKVGASGCSHGMWAYKEKSITGYSPKGDCIFHSFRNGDNYWDMCINDTWMHEKYAKNDNEYFCPDFTLKQIKEELAKGGE